MKTRLLSLAIVLTITGCTHESSSIEQCHESDTDSDTDTEPDSDTDTDTETDTSDYLYWEDFDEYEAGDFVVEDVGDPWWPWTKPSKPEWDGEISDDQALSLPNSLHIVNDNDVYLNTDFDKGHFLIEFDVFVPEGNLGYYAFRSWFTGHGWFIVFSVHLYSGGIGSLNVSGEQTTFEFNHSEWVACSHLIDIDEDLATITIGGEEVLTWPWNNASGGYPTPLENINFYGLTDPPGSSLYIDNIRILEM